MITVSALYHYPIKSCKGISLSKAEISDTGIKHDREFMVINAETSRFLTQRELPKMALIEVHTSDSELSISSDKSNHITIPIRFSGEKLMATIWKNTVEVIDQGDKIAEWLSNFLDKKVRLVRMAKDFKRAVNQDYALKKTDSVNFPDGYPLLLLSEESLQDLNSRMNISLPMNRFRPNIVFKGGEAYFEDTIKRFKAGSVIFTVVKSCVRCVITTTDQDTTIRGKEPLTTLATYRRHPTKSGVIFGQNIIQENLGTIHVGDKVEILETK